MIRITTTPAPAAVECAGARPSAPSASSAPAPNANPANVFAARDLQTVAVDADGRSKDADPTVRESASKPGRGDAADARSVAEGAAANPAVDRSVAVALDFETRNTGGCDLENAGAWRYASDEATEVLTLTFQVDGGAHQLWTPAMGLCDPLSSLASDPSTSFVCFAGFELAVWQRIMVEQFGFAPVPIHRWIDVQAACSYFALPRSLGNVLQVIQAPVVKDEAGKRLVRSLSKPNERTGKYAEVTREILERVAAYNRIDVEGLIAVHTALGTYMKSPSPLKCPRERASASK